MSAQDGRIQETDVAKEKQSPTVAKQPILAWKKIAIVGVCLAIIIGLSVGLGVGLTRHKGGSGDNNNDNNTNVELRNVSGRSSKWTPRVGDSWQITLHNTVLNDGNFTPDVTAWDMDMFENDKETIEKLHNLGKKVICYFSAGTWEKGRVDASDFLTEDLGGTLPEWKDERWARISSTKVRDIMKRRIALAAEKGCDAIDPDNVDGFVTNAENNLGLTAQDSINYLHFLHDEANKYNMSVGLKNAADIIDDVMGDVDFSVNEQCAAQAENPECTTFHKFIDAGKPVFHIEYPPDRDSKTYPDDLRKEICARKGRGVGSDQFSTVFKRMDLDGWVQFCNGDVFETALVPDDKK